jgi:hypothetical protein
MPNLSAGDRKIVQQQLVQLPPRTKAAQEKEMGEMMGKLKQVTLPSWHILFFVSNIEVARQWDIKTIWLLDR